MSDRSDCKYDVKFITTGNKDEMVRLSNMCCRTCNNVLWENDDVLTKYWCEKCDEYGWW